MCFKGNYIGFVFGFAIVFAQLLVVLRAAETRRYMRIDRPTVLRVTVMALVMTLPIAGFERFMTGWFSEEFAREVCIARPALVGICFVLAVALSISTAGSRAVMINSGVNLLAREKWRLASIMLCLYFPTAFAMLVLMHYLV